MDYRAMYDRDYLGAWDLPSGKDVTVTMKRVEAATLTGQGGRKTKKPVVWFEGKEKGLALCKTNAKTIAGMYGNNTASWGGKRIALYSTQTQFGSETVECIRIRGTIPRGKVTETPPEERTHAIEEPHDAAEPE